MLSSTDSKRSLNQNKVEVWQPFDLGVAPSAAPAPADFVGLSLGAAANSETAKVGSWEPVEFTAHTTTAEPPQPAFAAAAPAVPTAAAPAIKAAAATPAPALWQVPDLVAGLPEKNNPDDEEDQRSQVSQETFTQQAYQILQDATEKASDLLHKAEARAEELIRKAQAQADGIMSQAEANAAQVTNDAQAAGLAVANAQTAELIQTASSIVEEVGIWRETMFAQSEMMMLRLVIEIAQSIFGEGLPLDPEALGQAFSRALVEAKSLGDLRVYVHPDDAAALGEHWTHRQVALSGQRVELVSSDIIKRGGCFVEGQYGSVDARVDTQLKMAKDALFSTLSNANLQSLPAGDVR